MNNQHKLVAVEGQLNYGFTVPQNTVFIKDTNEINICETQLSQIRRLFTQSQNQEHKLQTIIDIQSKEITQLRIYVASLSVLSTLLIIGVFVYLYYRYHISSRERS